MSDISIDFFLDFLKENQEDLIKELPKLGILNSQIVIERPMNKKLTSSFSPKWVLSCYFIGVTHMICIELTDATTDSFVGIIYCHIDKTISVQKADKYTVSADLNISAHQTLRVHTLVNPIIQEYERIFNVE